MIVDTLKNIAKYKQIPKIGKIISFINNHNLIKLPEGEIEIEGRNLFVKVLRYIPKKAKKNNFEIHKKYIDLQLVLKGEEKIQFSNASKMNAITRYNRRDDFQFFACNNCISDIILYSDEFAVFFTKEPHRPGCIYKLPNPVLKLVFKIKNEK